MREKKKRTEAIECLSQIASLLFDNKLYKESKIYFGEAIELSSFTSKRRKAQLLSQYAFVYSQCLQRDEAIRTWEESLEL